MGVTLVEQWIKSGHHVLFGARAVSLALKRGELSQVLTGNHRVVSVSQSARDGEVILIAVPGAAVSSLLDSYL